MINEYYRLTFNYDKFGKGFLKVLREDKEYLVTKARTGSVGQDGKLKNAISPITWFIRSGLEVPAQSERDLMLVFGMPGQAWKIRLWTKPTLEENDAISHILIHPDGSKDNKNDGNGTDGCIGTLTNAIDFYDFFKIHNFNLSTLKLEVGIV